MIKSLDEKFFYKSTAWIVDYNELAIPILFFLSLSLSFYWGRKKKGTENLEYTPDPDTLYIISSPDEKTIERLSSFERSNNNNNKGRKVK